MNPSALPGLSSFFSQWLFSLDFVFNSAGLLCLSSSQSQLVGGFQCALLKQLELLVSMVAVTCQSACEHSQASSQLWRSLCTSCLGISCQGAAVGSPGGCLVPACGPAALCYWLPCSKAVVWNCPQQFQRRGTPAYREQFI